MNINNKHFIYVLECKNDKFYVGKTFRNPQERFLEHIDDVNCKCVWTSIHKPIQIIKVIDSYSNFIEDIITKKYMIEYGIDNVRGGSYSNVKLLEWQVTALQKEFLTIQNKCYICHQPNHLAPNCPNAANKKRKYNQVEKCNSPDNSFQHKNIIEKLEFFFKLVNFPIDLNLIINITNSDAENHKKCIIIMLEEVLDYINKSPDLTNSLIFTNKNKSYYEKYSLKVILIQFATYMKT